MICMKCITSYALTKVKSLSLEKTPVLQEDWLA
jgi:hypothetical protein